MMPDGERTATPISLRTDLRPGDLGAIVSFHGIVYARERGFNPTFEAYVAGPLAQFVCSATARDRLWIAERESELVGCVALVGLSELEAQLRWFLVAPSVRGHGLGKRLLSGAVAFADQTGYRRIILWTESVLTTAAHLYRAAGFRKTEERASHKWGADIIEERYERDS